MSGREIRLHATIFVDESDAPDGTAIFRRKPYAQPAQSLDTGGQDAFPASLVDGRVRGVDGRYFEPFQAGSNGRRQSGGSASDY
jgi:hypothetical protein